MVEDTVEMIQLGNQGKNATPGLSPAVVVALPQQRHRPPPSNYTAASFLQRIPRGLGLKCPLPSLPQCPCLCWEERGRVGVTGGRETDTGGEKKSRSATPRRGGLRGPSWAQVRQSLARGGVLVGRGNVGRTSVLRDKSLLRDKTVLMRNKSTPREKSPENSVLRDKSMLRDSSVLRESVLRDSRLGDSVNTDSILSSVGQKSYSVRSEQSFIRNSVMKDQGVKKMKKPPPLKDHDVCYKVLLIGDSGVGKTALVRAITGKEFMPKTLTTVGMDFVTTTVNVDGARIKLQIWDTAGQERFRSMTRFQFRGTQGALLAYDITDRESFKTLKYWLQMIDTEIDKYNKEPIPVFLIGNKTDIPEQRKVPYKKGTQLSQEHIMRGFLETSAKTSQNVTEAFTQLAQSIIEINNPKLLDSYLDPLERTEKYEQKQREAEAIAMYQLQKQRNRIKLPSSMSRAKSFERVQKCCNS